MTDDVTRATVEQMARDLDAEPEMVKMALPPYDSDAICPKCGNDEVNTIYESSGCSYPARCGVRWNGGEHLDRSCQRCHYVWAEAVLPEAICRAALEAVQAQREG